MVEILVSALLLQAPMAMTTLARGGVSNVMDSREVVVRTAAEWQQVWRAHSGSDAGRPAVDFTKQMVVGVFVGARNTGGYSVEITGVDLVQNALVVRYTEKAPDPDAIVAQVITAPFHLVSVQKLDGPVRFERAGSKERSLSLS
jgi:hypothetical protein